MFITRRALLALSLCAFASVGLVGCGGGSGGPTKTVNVPGPAPSASELTGKIVYSQSSRGANDQTVFTGYIAEADGTQAVTLPVDGVLSPDGTKIASSGYDSTTFKSSVRTTARDGSDRRLIAEGKSFGPVTWSPDSQTLAYAQEFDRVDNGLPNVVIFLASADGAEAPRRFSGAGEFNTAPSFSPDGNSLIYVASSRPGSVSSEITLAALDGSNARVLVAPSGTLLSPIFSPDGQQFAYTRTVASSNNFSSERAVYISGRDGGSQRLVAQGSDINSLAFSPDNRFLAYSVGSSLGAGQAPNEPVISIYITRADSASAPRLFAPEAGRGNQTLRQWRR